MCGSSRTKRNGRLVHRKGKAAVTVKASVHSLRHLYAKTARTVVPQVHLKALLNHTTELSSRDVTDLYGAPDFADLAISQERIAAALCAAMGIEPDPANIVHLSKPVSPAVA